MSETSVNNKRIAKNTLYMYARMIVMMVISLFTTRITFRILGVDNYGIYNIVGGIIVFFTFINQALTTATRRYITAEIATGTDDSRRNVFSIALLSHGIISLVIVAIAELIGLYIVNAVLNIPEDRMFAANVVYQLSIVSAIVGIMQAPYTAAITAYEKMSIYAYYSVVEAVLKLIGVLVLYFISGDKLIVYAVTMLLSTIIINFIYRLYCLSHFSECKFKMPHDKKLLKEMFGFMGWSLFGQASVVLTNQGVSVLESISILEQRHSALLKFLTGLRKKEFVVIPNLYEEDTRKLLEIRGKLDSANKALMDIENRVEEESRLSDILQNLLASSQSIVEHIKGSKCPLCGCDYKQHENLLVAISENTVLSSSLKEDIEKRDSARKDVEDIEHGLRNQLDKLTDEVEEHINKTVEEIAKVKKDRENINNQLKQLLSDKTKNEATFTERFSDFKDCTEDEVRNKYEKANQNINCELNNQKSRLAHNQTELAKLIEAMDKLREDIKKCDMTIAQLNADTFFTQYLHTAGTDDISQYKLDDWKKQKEEVLAESVKWKKEIDDANAEISKLKEEGVDESKVISLQQRQISFSSEYTEVKERLTGTYNFLKTKCLMESISLPMDSEQINTVYQEAIRKSHERRSDLSDKSEVVKEYIRIIGVVGKYSENESLKKQYDVVESKRKKYIKNKEIVDLEKTRLEKYLKDFVNGFFKLDIINKLYNTIDPHPEYKKISFECDFSLKDPRLNVLMYSEKDDHDSIVPNLYFSTAQINILSFCIFMAKALFAKTDKKDDLGCIFIDDPVQALDDINILSMIDLLRNVAFSLDKQIVLTTHDKDFFELMKMKVPDRLFNSRFIEFRERGVIE